MTCYSCILGVLQFTSVQSGSSWCMCYACLTNLGLWSASRNTGSPRRRADGHSRQRPVPVRRRPHREQHWPRCSPMLQHGSLIRHAAPSTVSSHVDWRGFRRQPPFIPNILRTSASASVSTADPDRASQKCHMATAKGPQESLSPGQLLRLCETRLFKLGRTEKAVRI